MFPHCVTGLGGRVICLEVYVLRLRKKRAIQCNDIRGRDHLFPIFTVMQIVFLFSTSCGNRGLSCSAARSQKRKRRIRTAKPDASSGHCADLLTFKRHRSLNAICDIPLCRRSTDSKGWSFARGTRSSLPHAQMQRWSCRRSSHRHSS